MSTVQDIQNAIAALPPLQYRELEQWWEAHQEQLWDKQLACDSQPGGRLEPLLSEIDADIDAGNVTPFPK